MKTAKKAQITLCGFFLLSLALISCQPSGNTSNSQSAATPAGTAGRSTGTSSGDEATAKDNLYSELCRKYDSCGCQKYDDCMAQAANSPALEDATLRACMTKSSCASLCAGRPDGCLSQGSGGGGGPSTGQQRSNCAAIPCSKDSDCPSDCYGRCNGTICLSF